MTADELRQIIAQLPGGRRVTVVIIENTGTGATVLEAPATGTANVGGAQHVSTILRPAAVTPLEVAREILRDTPTSRLTPVEWSRAFDGAIKVREVKRALDKAVLEHEERGEGRGHGAVVITPVAMVAYLMARHDAITSRGKRPAWFARVVKGATHAS